MRAIAIVALLLLGALLPGSASAEDAPARVIARRIAGLRCARSSHALLRVTTGERRFLFEVFTLGADRVLVRTLSPPQQLGNAQLFAGDRAWSYNHAYRQIARLARGTPPPAFATLLLGLLPEAAEPERFEAVLAGTETPAGAPAQRIELRPRAGSGKTETVELVVRILDDAPIRARYRDPGGAVTRTLFFADPRPFGSLTLPGRVTLVDAADPDARTEVEIERLEVDPPLDERLFWLGRLRL